MNPWQLPGLQHDSLIHLTATHPKDPWQGIRREGCNTLWRAVKHIKRALSKTQLIRRAQR